MLEIRRSLCVLCNLCGLCVSATPAVAQHPAFRVKGRVVTERGEPIATADVRLEAFYGSAAGTFAGQRRFSAQTDGRGECGASPRCDAARNRTHDRDEQKFRSAAIGDLATVRVR